MLSQLVVVLIAEPRNDIVISGVQTSLVLLKVSHLIAETLKRGGRVICLARCGIESFFCFRELGYSSPTNVILVNPEALLVLPAKCKTVGAVFYGFFRQEPT